MKKIIAAILSILIIASFTACNDTDYPNSEGTHAPSANGTNTPIETHTQESTEIPQSSTPTPEYLGDKERLLLMGEVVPITDGMPVDDSFAGITIDLDCDGNREELTLQKIKNEEGKDCYQFVVNGECAYGDFEKDAGYALYLASVDEGKSISILLSKADHLYAVSFPIVNAEAETNSPYPYTIVRLNGEGKTITDFKHGMSIREYIADGWKYTPYDGDEIDIDNNGDIEKVGVSLSEWNNPYMYLVGIDCERAENSSASSVDISSYYPENATTAEMYDEMFYILNEDGTISIECRINYEGEEIVNFYDYEEYSTDPSEYPKDGFSFEYMRWNLRED